MSARVRVEIVVPVLNEEVALPRSVPAIVGFARQHLAQYDVVVHIADNGSTDGTEAACARLCAEYPEVKASRLAERGRGRALRAAWTRSDAELLAYMDVDLSADLAALPRLLQLVADGGCDIAIGSRHAPDSTVQRSMVRDVISRGYNVLIRAMFPVAFTDAQCGFKALRASVARDLIPRVQDDGWFFDSELLILAADQGLRIGEVGLRWVEDLDSRVHIVSTAVGDLRGLLRLRLGGLARARAGRA